MAGHNVVAPQPGEIFGDDHVDLLGFDVADHPLKIRAVKVSSRPTIIDVSVVDRQPMLLHKIIQEGFLIVDAF